MACHAQACVCCMCYLATCLYGAMSLLASVTYSVLVYRTLRSVTQLSSTLLWGCPAHERVSRSLVRSTATMRSLATRVLIAAALTPEATAFVTLDWYAAAW